MVAGASMAPDCSETLANEIKQMMGGAGGLSYAVGDS